MGPELVSQYAPTVATSACVLAVTEALLAGEAAPEVASILN